MLKTVDNIDSLSDNQVLEKKLGDFIDLSPYNEKKYKDFIYNVLSDTLDNYGFIPSVGPISIEDFDDIISNLTNYIIKNDDIFKEDVIAIREKRVLLNRLSFNFLSQDIKDRFNSSLSVKSTDNNTKIRKIEKNANEEIVDFHKKAFNIVRVLSKSIIGTVPTNNNDLSRLAYELSEKNLPDSLIPSNLLLNLAKILTIFSFSSNEVSIIKTNYGLVNIDYVKNKLSSLSGTNKVNFEKELVLLNSGIGFLLLSFCTKEYVDEHGSKLSFLLKSIEQNIIQYKYGINVSNQTAGVFLNSTIEEQYSNLEDDKKTIISQIILENPVLFLGNNEIRDKKLFDYLINNLDLDKYKEIIEFLSKKKNKKLSEKRLLDVFQGNKVEEEVEVVKDNVETITIIHEPEIFSPDNALFIEEDHKNDLLEVFGEDKGSVLYKKIGDNKKLIKKIIKIGGMLIAGDKYSFVNIYIRGNRINSKKIDKIIRVLDLLVKNHSNIDVIRTICDIELDGDRINYLFKLNKENKSFQPDVYKKLLLDFLGNGNKDKLNEAYGMGINSDEQIEFEKIKKFNEISDFINGIKLPLTKKGFIDKMKEIGFNDLVSGGNHLGIVNDEFGVKIPVPLHNMSHPFDIGLLNIVKKGCLVDFKRAFGIKE